jgi:high-affinity nickel permease
MTFIVIRGIEQDAKWTIIYLTAGFTLGIKHATEPDHVIAVSTIASQTKRLSRSSLSRDILGVGPYSNPFTYRHHGHFIGTDHTGISCLFS